MKSSAIVCRILPTISIVPTWSGAFVYDTEGLEPALEIIEFANSQLLQFRIGRRAAGGGARRIYPAIQQRRCATR